MRWLKLTRQDGALIWLNVGLAVSIFRAAGDYTQINFPRTKWYVRETPEEIAALLRPHRVKYNNPA